MYHALADGTGALGFLKTLLYYYITIKHKEDFKDKLPVLDYDATVTQKNDDSFLKHYTGENIPKKIKITKAYRMVGRRPIDHRLKVIEGEMSVKEVLALAHQHNTTLTIYLTALFIKAIYSEMPARSRKYPVVLSVPVNLRAYFPSVTARNFLVPFPFAINLVKGKIHSKYYRRSQVGISKRVDRGEIEGKNEPIVRLGTQCFYESGSFIY